MHPLLGMLICGNGTVYTICDNVVLTCAVLVVSSDGAAAMVVMSMAKAESLGLKPMAKVIGWADAEQRPSRFCTSPALAIPLALKRAGKTATDVDLMEVNEAFSVVAIEVTKMVGVCPTKTNVNGGAVAIGHPIGSST